MTRYPVAIFGIIAAFMQAQVMSFMPSAAAVTAAPFTARMIKANDRSAVIINRSALLSR